MGKVRKITFSKSLAGYILNIFEGMFEPKCIFCKKHINKGNLSAVVKGGFVCGNIICLIKHTEQKERG